MWFLGLVIGGLLGAAIGDLVRWDSAWMIFAGIGAAAAMVLKSRGVFDPEGVGRLEQRIAILEREVIALNAALRAAPSVPPVASSEDREPVDTARAAAVEAPVLDRTVVPREAPHVAADSPSLQPAKAGPLAPKDPQPVRIPAGASASTEPNVLWQKLLGGNILAKIGVVLLLFGIGSALKLAIDFGFFPAPVRLLLATLAGIAMIAFGYSRVRIEKHRMFALALQGGGFGVLYLVTYFALSRYAYIDHATAFSLFAALGIACLFLAVRLEGEPLAILGISGAFMAPLLASSGSGSHIVLFSFYAVLTVLVLAVNALRPWRMLMVTAFSFTLVTGMSWASLRFEAAHFASTEAFLVLFTVLYSFAPILSAIAGRGSLAHWADSALLFGTPIAAAVSQTWMLERTGFGSIVLAWSAVGAGLYYSALAAALYANRTAHGLRSPYAMVAVAFYTLAVPLAFRVQVTTAFWAIEGLALAWYGLARERRLPYVAGVALQLVAGAWFLLGSHGSRLTPLLNDTYVGCLVIAGCGVATAWLTRRARSGWLDRNLMQIFSALAGAWALVWWFGANGAEISRFAPNIHKIALYTVLLIVTAWSLFAIGRGLSWPGARHVSLLPASASLLGAIFAGWSASIGHAMHDSMVLALPAAFVSFYVMLAQHERDGMRALIPEAHVYGLWLLTVALLREALWVADRLAPGSELWTFIAWQLVPAGLVCITVLLERHRVWPVKNHRDAYLLGVIPLLVTAFAAAVVANFSHHGGEALPYLPFASFFDVAQMAVIFTIAWWSASARSVLGRETIQLIRLVPPAVAFVWLSAMAMRLAHHWGGVAFEADALMRSGFAQSLLSMLWTALALAVMIRASQKRLRGEWFAGFGLLGVVGAKFMLVDVVNKGTVTWALSLIGVGLLILAASYFSPAPPRADAEATS